MKRKLNVLIACEESQTICKEFRRLGHNAYSCDLQECSGGHPEWHIHGDCLDAILQKEEMEFYGEYIPVFHTQDGERHILPRHRWDLIIAHPPCTYLSNAGRNYMSVKKYGNYAIERKEMQQEAISFFNKVRLECDINSNHFAIENPLGCIDGYDQVIQPWEFGDNVQKSTCLWLHGLPKLIPETTVRPDPDYVEHTNRNGVTRRYERFFYETRFLPKEERQRKRSKTFPGIARAIAIQWSEYILNHD